MFARTYAGEHHLRPYLSVNIMSVSIYICHPKGAYVEDRVVCDVRVEMCTRLYTTAVPVNIMSTYISNRNLYGADIIDTVVYHAAAVSYRFVFYVRPYCCTPFSSVNELHVCTYIYVSFRRVVILTGYILPVHVLAPVQMLVYIRTWYVTCTTLTK